MRVDPVHPTTARRQRGFTLFELVIVIVIGGVIAASLTVFFRPAFDSYLAVSRRSALSAQADTALRRLVTDIRKAVPNSIRSPNDQCFELVPTTTGGRLRMAPDTVNDSAPGCAPSTTCSASVDITTASSAADVLSTLSTTPSVGDWLVAGNQSPDEVYSGTNRTALTTITTPTTTPATTFGTQRLEFNPLQFPLGFSSGRFSVVSASEQAVFYVCSGANGSLDANGDGSGVLVRLANYGFNASYPSSCPDITGGQVVAKGVSRCSFVYDPNKGATQQNGFVYLELELTRSQERSTLMMGAHVNNMP